MWKLHAKLLKENRRIDPVENKKITKATNLKIGQPVFVRDHQKGTFNPTYFMIIEFQKSYIIACLCSPFQMGKERKCNIHHMKPKTPVDASPNAFNQF